MSEVANGGQVLIDETTFSLIKDALSVLGTVSESGYDDDMLRQLTRAAMVGKLQRHVACQDCYRCVAVCKQQACVCTCVWIATRDSERRPRGRAVHTQVDVDHMNGMQIMSYSALAHASVSNCMIAIWLMRGCFNFARMPPPHITLHSAHALLLQSSPRGVLHHWDGRWRATGLR